MILASHYISVRVGYLTAAKRRIRHNSPMFVDVYFESERLS